MSLIPDLALAENTSQPLPCVVVLDGSSSMAADDAIGALNEGLKALADDLKADDVARQRVRILLIRIGEPDDVQIVTDWTDAIGFVAPVIEANGMTPLGAGVRRALSEIEAEKRRFDQHGIPSNRPWLFIITDGEPTDSDWQAAAAECAAAEAAGKVTVFGIAVGPGATTEKLGRFSSARKPAQLKGLAFRELFLWLSRSAKVGSKSAPTDAIQMAAPDGWAVIPGAR